MGSEPTEVASIPNDPEAIGRVRDRLADLLVRHGFPEASAFAIRLAFEEAISNAFRHGHGHLPREERVEVRLSVDPSRVQIEVEDRGPGFDPTSIPDPTLLENLEKPSGRGLMLMRAYMTSVEHNERGNRVRMVYVMPDSRANVAPSS